MKVLILEECSMEVALASQRLQDHGHAVSQTDRLPRALAEMRVNTPDLLIANLFPNAKRGDAESALSVALAGQFHNPDLVTVLLSDSALFSQGELFAMLSSLRCVLRRPVEVGDLMEIVIYFLEHGPVDCAPGPGTPDICAKCLLDAHCSRSFTGKVCGAPASAVAG